jgi:hypothetical protein
MKYSLVELGMGDDDVGANFGLCLPRACSDKLVTKLINSALTIVGTDFKVAWINSDT